MWIVDAKEMQDKQDMLHVNKSPAASRDAGLIKSSQAAQKEKSVLEEMGLPEKEDGVKLDLSDEAMDMYLQQLEAQKDSAEAAGDAVKELGKLMEIARRIAKGDKVPAKDERKLMEYSNELYQTAKMSAVMNRNRKHKKHKSLFEDEENKDTREKLRALENDAVPEASGSGDAGTGAAEIAVETGSDTIETE